MMDNVDIRIQKALVANDDKYQMRETNNKAYLDNQLR